jgi:FkbM family methyltransferase
MRLLRELLSRLNKPEYFMQPKRLMNKAVGRTGGTTNPAGECADITFWGQKLVLRKGDALTQTILSRGVHELLVTEALWRLTEAGDRCVDAGANIGYFTTLLAYLAHQGEVLAFEPHPGTHRFLAENVQTARESMSRCSAVRTFERGLGSSTAVVSLSEPAGFEHNSGVARITSNCDTGNGSAIYEISLVKLDDVVKEAQVGVMKIDVEGYEHESFKGAKDLLQSKRIRDIVFEEHDAFPSPVCEMFLKQGYQLFELRRGLWGPLLSPPTERRWLDCTPLWEPANYLATANPSRCIARFSPRGWTSLRGRALKD